MQIIESDNVDLLSPFPLTEAKRVFGWMHAYKSVIETDESPKTPEQFAEYFSGLIPNLQSYAVIDKHNALEMKHEVPLIGMVAFQPVENWRGYIHIASTRRAWGSGLFEEGVKRAITHLYETNPQLLTINGMFLSKNYPVRGLAKRLGFWIEGFLPDAITQNGVPQELIIVTTNKRRWMNNGIHEEHSPTRG
jgi:RimJ/RimL family protein N-acetyltransferase